MPLFSPKGVFFMERVEAASCQDDSMAAQIPLAISSVPMQQFVNVANGADGLKMGTIFEDLYLNFYCTECRKCGCGQNQYTRRQDYLGIGFMSGNASRNGRNYNNNSNCGNHYNNGSNTGCGNNYNNGSNTGCGCSYNNRSNAGRNNNYNNRTNTSCDNNYNSGSNMDCGNNRNNRRSGCRMNNCNCQS